MQATILNKLMSPVRFFASVTCAALFLIPTLLLSGALAGAQGPIVVSGAPVQLAPLTGGGWDGSQEPIGGTFVVGVNGDVLVGDGYSASFFQITPSGTETTLGAGLGGSAAALDSYGNLYFGGNYNANVYKVPYDAATGAYVGFTTAPTTNCMGGNLDTSACVFAPAVSTFMGTLKGGGNPGYAGMAFDGQGNFFFETNTLPATDPNSIFECNLACLASSSGTPTLVYKDSNTVGAMEVDPWGNIFFVDGGNSTGQVTNLNEIKLSSGSYASSPTVVLSYTNKAGYGNGISGLAIAGNGTLYISVNGDGIFAIPNTQSGGPKVSGMYILATQGGKGVALDSEGNVYGIPYNNGDVVSYIPVNNFVLGTEPVGTAATAVSATAFDSSGACTPTLSASATEFGVASTEFTATAGATCSTAFGGGNGTFSAGPFAAAGSSSFSVTLNFTPTAVGERNATLTIADTTNSAGGSAVLTGVGQGAMGNVDPGVLTAYTKGLTTPASVIADAAGDVFVADSGAGMVFEYPAGSTLTTTPTALGSGFVHPDSLAFDANGDLFVADNGEPDVVEIPNTGTTGAFTAGTQQTLISSSAVFDGAALKNAEALTVGPNGTLYISDTGNSRVVFYNLINGQSGVTLATSANGVSAPSGLAVDSSGNLYVADSGTDQIEIFSNIGVVLTPVTPPKVTKAVGVAVEASGALIVADESSPNIVRIPSLSGTLTTSQAVTIESISPQSNSLWMDSLGDLYVASSGGVSANAIQRTKAAFNIGIVADGANNTGTVYLMDAGNQPATLGDVAGSDITQPASYPLFQLSVAATDGCTPGSSSGPTGNLCAFTAEFAPPGGTAVGPYSGTADILVATPSISIPVTISGTAAASAALPQTITWTPPATGFVGQAIALSATATSGLAVSFATTTPSVCTVTGNTTTGFTATFNATGTCTINANQAGGSSSGKLYGAAPTVTNSILIGNITPTGKPALLMTQTTAFPSILGGGVLAGPIAAGISIGVGNNGYVAVSETYGGNVDIYNLAAGTVAHLGPFSNPGGVAADSAGNLYIAGQYNNQIAKLPYVNGAYATLTATSGTTPNCTSSTTTECILAPVAGVSAIGGIGAMAFDLAGDLFLATDAQGSAAFSIWECTAACLSTGTPAPVELYQEPAGTSPNQLYVGGLGVDPWGNLFFTDSNFVSQSSNSNDDATYSDVKELPTSAGAGYGGATTGYAAAPTTIQTFTDGSPGGYDDNLDALAVAPSGTVYYATLYDGVFAIPNTQSGGPVVANQYPVSGSGAKVLGVDKNGNLYEVTSALSEIAINDLTLPNAQYEGATVQASAAVIDTADGYCSSAAPTLVFASTNTDFSATAGSTCSGLSAGGGFTAQSSASSFPATVSFNPLNPGAQTTTLTVSDTTNGGEGTATVSAFAQTTPQTISFTAPTITTYTYTAPPFPVTITLTVANGGSNFPVVFNVDSKSTGAGTLSSTTVSGATSSATLTVTQAGTILIDANEPGSAVGGLVGGVYYSASNTATLTLTINPASQAIAFTPITPLTYTYSASPQVTVELSATGGASGNPVTFSVDSKSTGAGTVSATTQVGNASLATLTITQAGSIIIDANQALTVDYAAAPQVQQTITVNQAAQTITFIPPTQPIHFIPASSGIAGGITVPVSAIGGPSDNAIVFTVDKSSTMTGTFGASTVSGATSTATLTIPVQGSVVSGNIVIDATQPASTDYAAVTVTPLATIVILPPLPTQLITFNNPGTQVVGTALTLSATSSSSLPVSYVSTTTSVCTVSGSAVSFASVTSVSTCTIVAAQPGDNINYAAAPSVTQSFTVNPKGQSPNISLNLSLSTLTIQPGTVGLTQLTITSQNNFTGSLSLACTGLPSGYTCTFNPNPVSISEGGTATTTLTVTPPPAVALVRHDTRPLIPMTALAVALCFIGLRKRTRLQSLLLVVLAVGVPVLFASCGGSSPSTTTSPTTSTANVTVTASGMAGASGPVQQSTTLTVILE